MSAPTKFTLTPFAQADIDPAKHTYSKPIIDGIMGRSFIAPRMKLRIQGKCNYTSSTPWADGGRLDTATYDELVARKMRGEDLPEAYRATKLAEQISIALDDETTKGLQDYFEVVATDTAKTFVEENIFTRNLPVEVAKFNFSSPLAKQQNGQGVLRPSVEADSMKNAPTVRFATVANDAGDDYVYEDGCVKDLRSIADGGNGLLRGATVVALLEETGVWVKQDGQFGLKLRLAHIKVVPAPAEEGGASSADADRAASRAKEALEEWKIAPPPAKKQKGNEAVDGADGADAADADGAAPPASPAKEGGEE